MNVCVIEPGPIGILTVLMVKEYGANVTLIGHKNDINRLDFINDLNIADITTVEWESENSFDCVIDCTGNESAINNAFKFIKPLSQILLLGTNNKKISIDFAQIAYKELSVKGTLGANESDWIDALKFVERNES